MELQNKSEDVDMNILINELDEDYKNRFSNLLHVESISEKYSKFKKIVYLPDGSIATGSLEFILSKFIDECTNELNYYLSVKVDDYKEVVSISIIPIVESA